MRKPRFPPTVLATLMGRYRRRSCRVVAASPSTAPNTVRIASRFSRQDRNRDGLLHARELAAPPR